MLTLSDSQQARLLARARSLYHLIIFCAFFFWSHRSCERQATIRKQSQLNPGAPKWMRLLCTLMNGWHEALRQRHIPYNSAFRPVHFLKLVSLLWKTKSGRENGSAREETNVSLVLELKAPARVPPSREAPMSYPTVNTVKSITEASKMMECGTEPIKRANVTKEWPGLSGVSGTGLAMYNLIGLVA